MRIVEAALELDGSGLHEVHGFTRNIHAAQLELHWGSHAGILHPDHNPVVNVVDPDEGHPRLLKHFRCQVVMPTLEL